MSENRYVFEDDERFTNLDIFQEVLTFDIANYESEVTKLKGRFSLEIQRIQEPILSCESVKNPVIEEISFLHVREIKQDSDYVLKNFTSTETPSDVQEKIAIDVVSFVRQNSVPLSPVQPSREFVYEEGGQVDYKFPYKRVDPDVLSALYNKIRIGTKKFGGMCYRDLKPENLDILHEEMYVVSPVCDGIRCWYIIYQQEIYLHLRDGRMFLLGTSMLDSDIILDCEVMSDMSFVVLDIVYDNADLTSHTFFGRWADLHQIKDGSFVGTFSRQKYFPLGAIDQIDMKKGLVFTPVLGMYKFGNCDDIFVWRCVPPTLDLLYKDGKVFSSVYRNRKFVSYKHEWNVSLSRPDNMIVELKLDEETKQWNYLRDRCDKSYPNADFVVKSILSEVRVSYSVLMSVMMRYKRMFYVDGSISVQSGHATSLRLICKDGIYYCLWNNLDPVSQFVTLFLYGKKKIMQVMDKIGKKRDNNVLQIRSERYKRGNSEIRKSIENG